MMEPASNEGAVKLTNHYPEAMLTKPKDPICVNHIEHVLFREGEKKEAQEQNSDREPLVFVFGSETEPANSAVFSACQELGPGLVYDSLPPEDVHPSVTFEDGFAVKTVSEAEYGIVEFIQMLKEENSFLVPLLLVPERRRILMAPYQFDAMSGKLKPEAVFWGSLDGIKFLHRHGVIHGDIKPSNIMVDIASFKPVIIDFGAGGVIALEYGYPLRFQGTPMFLRGIGNEMKYLNEQDDYYALAKTIMCLIWQQQDSCLRCTEYGSFSWSKINFEDHAMVIRCHKKLWRLLLSRASIERDVAKFVDYYVEERWLGTSVMKWKHESMTLWDNENYAKNLEQLTEGPSIVDDVLLKPP